MTKVNAHPPAPAQKPEADLATTLRKHVGHQVRVVSEKIAAVNRQTRTVSMTEGVEAIAVRCDTCGEVVLEAVKRVKL
jgi:formylmethanofuran dehydrogenase subunit E